MRLFDKNKMKAVKEKSKSDKIHTILVVDDEEINVRSLAELLDEDYHVLSAMNGKEALELVKKDENRERIHLIISDQRMPEMKGSEFLEKSIPYVPKAKRIILTGFTDVDDIIDSINKGNIYKFILKPFDPNDMLLTVKRVLETFDLETENIVLTASNRKLADLNQTKEQVLKNLNTVYETHLQKLESLTQQLLDSKVADLQEVHHQQGREIQQIKEIIKPITSMYFSEQAIRNKRVLLAEGNKKQQILAKMALLGTGVELEIATTLEEGSALIEKHAYDILCFSADYIPLATQIHQQTPETQSVFMTSDDAPAYLPYLREYPYLSNIVSRNDEDRTFTLKNILTTVSKLLNNDLFGLEKYLNWGVEVKQHPITSSCTRSELIDSMESHLHDLGVRHKIVELCMMVSEELLMNAIFDAPCSSDGQPFYNHLSRTETVNLKPEEQGRFRYACDGMLLAVSAEDPFGAFDRQTILDYLQSCYQGQAGSLQKEKNKGGAGRGLFQIMTTADLVIFNVKPKVKTEVIAIFNIDPNQRKSEKPTSFHYFSG